MAKFLALVLVAACAGAGGSTTTTAPPAVTTAPVPSATTVPSPSTTEREGFHPDDPDITPIPPLSGEGAGGSGCEPGAGALPDGIWFGFVVERATTTLDFDLACFFVGDAANEAAAEDGVEEIPVPNDYYIRNENSTTRIVPVSSGTTVYSLLDPGTFATIDFTEWDPSVSNLACAGGSCLVWLYINGGAVTELVEQYTP